MIKNAPEIGLTPQRKNALSIIEAGFSAINTRTAIHHAMRRVGDALTIGRLVIGLHSIRRLIVVAVGKCAADAGLAIEEVLGDKITDGVVLDIRNVVGLKRLREYVGTHPMPSAANMAATKEILAVLTNLEKNDLVLFIISGGGSTLLAAPETGEIETEQKLLQAVFRAGADIREANILRKHLSLARGGGLAARAYPARSISLVFSDVPGDDLQFISSGPTVRDETTVRDAELVLEKYDLLRAAGLSECRFVETPKEQYFFDRAEHQIVVSNRIALDAMAAAARAFGYTAVLRETAFRGESRDLAGFFLDQLHAAPKKTALLWGGESTVTAKGGGRGGRNLEMALAGLSHVRAGELLAPVSSDGRDNGEFAGALCDIMTADAAARAGLAPGAFLERNDSYPFFESAGHMLETGPTGANVADLVIGLKD